MKHVRFALTAAVLAAFAIGPAAAAEEGAPTAYDLIFVNGTLDALPPERTLIYDRTGANGFATDAAENGTIELSLHGDKARLTLRRDERHRVLGEFPAGVGNPIIMYFVETVVRDVADAAGGNPFYIRNRMKEALLEAGEVRETSVEVDGAEQGATEVTLHPFAGDPNAARMRGFENLALSAIMSPEVPGLYQSLTASIPGEGDKAYVTRLTFDHMGEGGSGEASQ